MDAHESDNTPRNDARAGAKAEKSEVERFGFLAKVIGGLVAGLALQGAVKAAQPPTASASSGSPVLEPAAPFAISAEADEDVLVTMQRELGRALRKPRAKRRWGMVIDTRKCIGCSSCTVACVMENRLPPGVVYRPVIETEVGTYPNVTRKFLPRPCMQCDNPPCVPVCPVGATWKREDGIIQIDYNACIGCRYCITACPYQARTFDFGQNWTDGAAHGPEGALALDSVNQYEKMHTFDFGTAWNREEGIIPKSPVGNARKCTFCVHRLAQGMLPMCVTTCLGRATFFGDLNDPTSLVSQLASSPNAVRLKEDLNTKPKVYYLV